MNQRESCQRAPRAAGARAPKKVRVAVQRRCRSLEIEVRFRRAAKNMNSSWTKSLVCLSSSRRNVVIRPSTALMETLLAMFVPSSAPWRPFGLCVRRSPQQPARHTAPSTVAFGTIGGWFACSSAWVSVARHVAAAGPKIVYRQIRSIRVLSPTRSLTINRLLISGNLRCG